MLAGAENFAGSAQFEVGFRNAEPVGRFGQYAQAFFGAVGSGICHQHAVGIFLAASHSAAELVQSSQSETVRVLHHHDCGVGHVDADFNDGRGRENGVFPRKNLSLLFLSGRC